MSRMHQVMTNSSVTFLTTTTDSNKRTMDLVETTTKVERSEIASSFLGLLNKFFGAYLMLVVIIFGLVGNMFSIIIFVRQRRRNTAASVYLVSLAVSDTGNLVMSFQTWLHNGLFYVTNGDINIASGATDIGCQLRIFVWNCFVFMSGYIIIAYSIERCVAVWYPLKVASLFTSRRRNIILVILLLISFTFYCPAFLTYVSSTIQIQGITRRLCSKEQGILPTWILEAFTVWLFNTNMVAPVCIVFIINTLIVAGVFRASNNMHFVKDSKTEILQRKLVKNLFIISLIYFLSMAPYVIFRWVDLITGAPVYLLEWSTAISNFIVFNYAVNFIIYLCTLKYFRDDVRYLFCGRILDDEERGT
ncbi:neuropeptides capa receptor-like isoform X2 [Lineus longissimus]|uniref:neuropeptides capa receptor-like isoform X2 n=1 Tax=Lineus longissimus TaxID=88925 RepID=UPI00315DB531